MRELKVFGDGAVFDHAGVAVRSIRASAKSDPGIIRDEAQKVSVAFVDIGGIKLELIEPAGEDSPVASSLEKGQRLVHLCFRVPDMDAAIKKGRENGFHCIAKPVPARAFGGRKIAWLFSKTYGLTELLEE